MICQFYAAGRDRARAQFERQCAPVLLSSPPPPPSSISRGTELPDLEQARAEAIADARTLMSIAMIDGHTIFGRSVEIRDRLG